MAYTSRNCLNRARHEYNDR